MIPPRHYRPSLLTYTPTAMFWCWLAIIADILVRVESVPVAGNASPNRHRLISPRLREARLASTAAGFLHSGPPLFTCAAARLAQIRESL